ncbi:nuclear hormone receptor FTZ-F1 isoform X2 [Daktulosphaira vitifoliae]|uniref:nuclear hormone receptor FTZ-F1 isoform X2 n=1 Tax=Daktulosphaira vitifoliae TaxID=58002 RepID=UPI0021AA8361|nr:nuclear hormone receptor FTZ-F1 isoform X2 [Daktulosphaira vitifoliae]
MSVYQRDDLHLVLYFHPLTRSLATNVLSFVLQRYFTAYVTRRQFTDQKCMDLSNLNESDQTFIDDTKCMDLSQLSDDDRGFIEGSNGGVSGSMDGLQQYVTVNTAGGGTPVSATTINPSASSELPDTKEGIEELCPVCGDKVSGYHYGLLTCESCKGFFKRTVQNKKVYTCVAERSCHIDKTQRKRCPFCRFQKCLEVGMKLEAVRADRMRGGRNKFGPMYKRDRARKLQMMRQRQMAVQTIRGGVVTSAAANNHHQFAMLAAGDAVTLGQYPGSTITSTGSNLHIKQEIQIPQVSSLTSSPDSSPSPIAVALGQAGLGSLAVAAATTCAVNQHSQMTLQIVASANGNNNNNNNNNNSSNNNNSVSNMNAATGQPQQHQHHQQQAQQQSQPQGAGAPGSLISVNKMWSPPTSPKNYLLAATTHQQQAQQQQHHVMDNGGSSSATTPTGATAAGGQTGGHKGMSPVIREFVQGLDDREWQSSLFGLLQSQTYNQCEVDLFELMCKVLDQNLFSQVDWARNSVFFKDLKVDDQMKLLQHSWSDMLVLDHIHQHMHNNLANEIMLHNGQKFDLLALGLLGVTTMADCFARVVERLQELKFDVGDYICLKFLLLLNPDVKGIGNSKHVQEGHEQVLKALLDYCITANSQVQDKFTKLLSVLPDIHHIATRGEESLYMKHCSGGAPTQTLLMEMLHAKRK